MSASGRRANYGHRALQRAQAGEGSREDLGAGGAVGSGGDGEGRAGWASGERAFYVLRKWVNIAPTLEYRSWMLGNMGLYLAQAGQEEAALKISDAACRTAEKSGSAIAPYFRLRERAQTLAALNQHEAALGALEGAAPLADGFPDCRLRHRLLQAEYLMALRRMAESAAALAPALAETSHDLLNYLRPQAERLALRLYGTGNNAETLERRCK